jgi:putative hemolysin
MLGGDPDLGRESITEEELRDLVAAHEALSTDERNLISEVFAAGERELREVMVPRTEVQFLDAVMPLAKAAGMAGVSPHSRFPVFRGSHDTVIGFVHVRDLFGPRAENRRGARVGDLVRPVAMLPDSRTVLNAMSDLRRSGQHIAVVVDEYGGTAGIVTLEDLIEELVGDIRDEYDQTTRGATRLAGGVFEVDGLLNLDEFAEATGVRLPDGPYETVAGCLLTALGTIPAVGDSARVAGLELAVAEMDGRRIARVRATPVPEEEPGPAEEAQVGGAAD